MVGLPTSSVLRFEPHWDFWSYSDCCIEFCCVYAMKPSPWRQQLLTKIACYVCQTATAQKNWNIDDLLEGLSSYEYAPYTHVITLQYLWFCQHTKVVGHCKLCANLCLYLQCRNCSWSINTQSVFLTAASFECNVYLTRVSLTICIHI